MSNTNTGCKRCGGTGFLPQFRHVDGGACFECCEEQIRDWRIATERHAREVTALAARTPDQIAATRAEHDAIVARAMAPSANDLDDACDIDLRALFAEVSA